MLKISKILTITSKRSRKQESFEMKATRGHVNSIFIFGFDLHGHKYICTMSEASVTKSEFSMKKLQKSHVYGHFWMKMPQNSESK